MAHSDERIYSQLDLRIRLARSDWITESVGNPRAILAGSSNPGATWVTSAKSAFFIQVTYLRLGKPEDLRITYHQRFVLRFSKLPPFRTLVFGIVVQPLCNRFSLKTGLCSTHQNTSFAVECLPSAYQEFERFGGGSTKRDLSLLHCSGRDPRVRETLPEAASAAVCPPA
jgi:hypothetical protein